MIQKIITLSICIAVALPGLADATSIQHGHTMLTPFSELKSTHAVVVAIVVSVNNIGTVNQPDQLWVYPEFTLEIEDILWGEPIDNEPVLGPNTFVYENECWSPKVVSSRPWVLPGDRVLMILEHHPEQRITGNNPGASWARWIYFIESSASSNTSSLLEQSAVSFDRDSIGGCGQGLTLTEMLGIVQVERVATAHTVEDVRNAIKKQ